MLPLRRRAGIGLGAGSFTLPKVSILHICRAWIVPSTSDAMQGRAVDRLYAPGLRRPVTLAQCECGIFTWYRRRNRASNDDRFWPTSARLGQVSDFQIAVVRGKKVELP